jgi:hypothetical protein
VWDSFEEVDAEFNEIFGEYMSRYDSTPPGQREEAGKDLNANVASMLARRGWTEEQYWREAMTRATARTLNVEK